MLSTRSTRAATRPAADELEWEALPDGRDGSEETLRRRQLRSRVRQAVARLPPRQREVVVLKDLSEMTYREVAETMELSEGAVKAHFHQAVSNLRKIMQTESP